MNTKYSGGGTLKMRLRPPHFTCVNKRFQSKDNKNAEDETFSIIIVGDEARRAR